MGDSIFFFVFVYLCCFFFSCLPALTLDYFFPLFPPSLLLLPCFFKDYQQAFGLGASAVELKTRFCITNWQGVMVLDQVPPDRNNSVILVFRLVWIVVLTCCWFVICIVAGNSRAVVFYVLFGMPFLTPCWLSICISRLFVFRSALIIQRAICGPNTTVNNGDRESRWLCRPRHW